MYTDIDISAAFGSISVTCFLAKLDVERLSHSTVTLQMSALKFDCKRSGMAHDLDSEKVECTFKGKKTPPSLNVPLNWPLAYWRI